MAQAALAAVDRARVVARSPEVDLSPAAARSLEADSAAEAIPGMKASMKTSMKVTSTTRPDPARAAEVATVMRTSKGWISRETRMIAHAVEARAETPVARVAPAG